MRLKWYVGEVFQFSIAPGARYALGAMHAIGRLIFGARVMSTTTSIA
jgi:hypothetical protein